MNIKDILDRQNFKFQKRLGQNFITDNNLLDAIVSDAAIEEDDVVVEVGAGAGTLTAALAKKAKRVIALEIDKALEGVLNQTVGELANVKVVFGDALKMDPEELKRLCGEPFKVVANLPYYITTPLIFYFLENDFEVKSITVMVQKEVAERMTAKPGGHDYGVLTLAVKSRAEGVITREVSRKLFRPQPEVDSAVIRMDIMDKGVDVPQFLKVVRTAFAMRRKTLVNNLTGGLGLSREQAETLVCSLGVPADVRAERLTFEQMAVLTQKISEGLPKQKI